MTEDDLERRLRESLHRDAERIRPRDRQTEILALAHDNTRVGEPTRRWLVPLAAAASVALVGAIAWGAGNTGGGQQVPPAATSTSATAPPTTVPAPKRSSLPTPLSSLKPPPPANPFLPSNPLSSGTSTASPNGTRSQVALPAYFVGSNSGRGDRFGLYREFVRTAVPVGATPAQKAKAAVALAMNAQAFTNYEPYVQPWSGTSVRDVAVTPGQITITLSGPGAKGFTAEQTRLGVQGLVWTAQAAIGQGPIPVKFVLADGSTKLFGTYPTSQTYSRPAKDQQYQDLAPIWITSPVRGEVFRAGAPVVAKGESCAFEATTQWQLTKGGTAIRSGVTTASSGCPVRGTWQVSLGVLPTGDYTFRMFELSMQEGKGVVAETSKPFTVR